MVKEKIADMLIVLLIIVCFSYMLLQIGRAWGHSEYKTNDSVCIRCHFDKVGKQ